jgi:hypothetical protein
VVQGPTDAVVTNPDKQSIIAVSYLLNNKVDNEFEVCPSAWPSLIRPTSRHSPIIARYSHLETPDPTARPGC